MGNQISENIGTQTFWPVAIYSTASAGLLTFFTGLYYMASKKSTSSIIKIPIDLNKQSVTFQDSIRKSTLYKSNSVEDCLTCLFDDCKTVLDALYSGFKRSGDNDCVGAINTEEKSFHWLKYSEIIERSKNFGSGLVNLGLNKDSFIGIYSRNSVEYVICEYGAYHYSMVVIPFYDTLGPQTCTYCINKANIECVVVDTQIRVETLISQANKLNTLKYIITTEKIYESMKSKAMGVGIKVYHIDEIEEIGKEKPKDVIKPKPSDIAVISYTSGTTGDPKGVILTHEGIVANVSGVMYQLNDYAPCKDDCLLSFLPLAHMFERCCEIALIMVGGKVGYFSGDIKRLSEDLQILKPTVLPVVPRLLNRIYGKAMATAKASKLKGWLLHKALKSKQLELENNLIRSDGFWDKLVFKQIKEGFGGNIRVMVVGSAPIAKDVLNFFRCALGCILCEGYGQTECVCSCTLTIPGDFKAGHVGTPIPSCYLKVIDVPEMNYFAKNGCGEICVKGPIVFKGYFKDEARTKETIDSEGWLHTGDIGCWLENGTLKIIDRKKDIFKLSQGEYISPEKVESVYSSSNYLSQIFIYGDSLKSSIVAIIVPESNAVFHWSRKNEIKGTFHDICKTKELKEEIFEDMNKVSKGKLNSLEQVKDIYLYSEPLTIENGLLTPTLKLKRSQCKLYFQEQINEMYKSID